MGFGQSSGSQQSTSQQGIQPQFRDPLSQLAFGLTTLGAPAFANLLGGPPSLPQLGPSGLFPQSQNWMNQQAGGWIPGPSQPPWTMAGPSFMGGGGNYPEISGNRTPSQGGVPSFGQIPGWPSELSTSQQTALQQWTGGNTGGKIPPELSGFLPQANWPTAMPSPFGNMFGGPTVGPTGMMGGTAPSPLSQAPPFAFNGPSPMSPLSNLGLLPNQQSAFDNAFKQAVQQAVNPLSASAAMRGQLSPENIGGIAGAAAQNVAPQMLPLLLQTPLQTLQAGLGAQGQLFNQGGQIGQNLLQQATLPQSMYLAQLSPFMGLLQQITGLLGGSSQATGGQSGFNFSLPFSASAKL